MALSPDGMSEAVIRNLKNRTGSSLEQWVRIARKSGLTEPKELRKWLKTEHGLGGTTCWIIADAVMLNRVDEWSSNGFASSIYTRPINVEIQSGDVIFRMDRGPDAEGLDAIQPTYRQTGAANPIIQVTNRTCRRIIAKSPQSSTVSPASRTHGLGDCRSGPYPRSPRANAAGRRDRAR